MVKLSKHPIFQEKCVWVAETFEHEPAMFYCLGIIKESTETKYYFLAMEGNYSPCLVPLNSVHVWLADEQYLPECVSSVYSNGNVIFLKEYARRKKHDKWD